MTLMKMNNID